MHWDFPLKKYEIKMKFCHKLQTNLTQNILQLLESTITSKYT